MTRPVRPPLALALLAALTLAPRIGAVEPPCEFEGVERVIAIGDVHGAYERFVEILHAADVMDGRDRWSGGKMHLVQLGDVVDRGPNSRKVLDLLRRLEEEAASVGGRVHALLGNHEVMRMSGDLRYASSGEYAEFVTPESEAVRQQYVETLSPDKRERTLSETPLGMVEMIRAFAPQGTYGSYMRGNNAVVRINGVLFLHGGISPAVASMRCAGINATIRKELSQRELSNTSLSIREDGPLWYRGLAMEPESFGPRVLEILAKQGARAMVVGHTVVPEGKITARFDKKVVFIDTGMLSTYVKDGRASALEVKGDKFTAIYPDRSGGGPGGGLLRKPEVQRYSQSVVR